MSSFNARLRLPGKSRIPLGVEVDVSDEVVTLRTGDQEVAKWSLEKLEVAYMSDGFHIKIDGEEVVLSVPESHRFASALGVTTRPAPSAVLPKSKAKTTQAAPGYQSNDELKNRISRVSEAIATDAVTPEAAFAEWLGLLKELNSRHARSAISTRMFHELNTRLLDLIPAPEPATVS